MMNILHLGVYGVLSVNGELLVVSKSRGPYLGKYDLPGGRIEFGETVKEALVREFQEEVGIHITPLSLLEIVEHKTNFKDEEGKHDFQHIALIYSVTTNKSMNDIKIGPDGHDSNGATLQKLTTLDQEKNMCTPAVNFAVKTKLS